MGHDRANKNSRGMEVLTFLTAATNYMGVERTFSMCFGDTGGYLLFGGVDYCHVSQRPAFMAASFSDHGGWSARVLRMNVEGNYIPVSTTLARHTVFDSGLGSWSVIPPLRLADLSE